MPRRERAARRGHTWDPWPCCDSQVDEADWYQGRPKKQAVCPSCQELIRLGRDARRRASEAGEATYTWCERHHDWPGYHGPYYFEHDRRPDSGPGEPWDAGDALRRRMFELVNILSSAADGRPRQTKAEPVLTCADTNPRDRRYECELLVTMDPKVQKALNALDAAMRNALKSTYRAGKGRGQNILVNLATNDMTVNEFNRRAAEDTD